MKLVIFGIVINLIVLSVSFYPALMAEYKKRHDIRINKKVAVSMIDEALAKHGKKREVDKVYRIQVMPDGKCVLQIYNKDKFKEGRYNG